MNIRTLDYSPYFVTVGTNQETEIIKQIKPRNVLISYFYWKNKSLKEWINSIGYVPNIMLDCGAYSLRGRNRIKLYDCMVHLYGGLLDVSAAADDEYDIDLDVFYENDDEEANTEHGLYISDYVRYYIDNFEYINNFVSVDVIGDADTSYIYYRILKANGYNPLPVIHYGHVEHYLEKYISAGADYICLGGTVMVSERNKVKDWVNKVCYQYPDIKFHLLGSTGKRIIEGCPLLCSSDSTTWMRSAGFGKPSNVPGTKADKAKHLIIETKQIAQVRQLVFA